MSKSQRNKGSGYEREVANLLSELLGQVVRRNIGQSRDGGDDITVGKFRIECKRRASIAVYPWMEQAEAACHEGQIPVVVMRGDQKGSLLVLRLEDGVDLIREALQEPTNAQPSL